MEICEPGQGRNTAAISSHLFVRWASHPRPWVMTKVSEMRIQTMAIACRICIFHSEWFNGDNPDAYAPREYVVVARRYRPQSFEQLIGQEHVAKGLAAAIAASRVGHAYLFTGARGAGKTSTARILAKALNCETGPTPTPCNECDICRSITAGDDVDVLEIDGASNRGIDEIRQLRQNVNVRPSRARFKIYIIDEVHMLTNEAFNALLKTLEEPPEHVKFIFCTTEPEKIPITILSRCQRFDFAGIQTQQIVERLQQIVAAEGVEAEPEALEILARRAAGSMRDSQSLLEQLLGVRLDERSLSPTCTPAGHRRQRTHRAAGRPLDRSQCGRRARRSRPGDGRRRRRRPIARSTAGLLPRHHGGRGRLPERCTIARLDAEQPAVREAAGRLGMETILAIMQILDHTLSRLKYLSYPRTVMELGLVRICQLENLDSLPELIAQLREGVPVATAAKSPAAAAQQPPASSRPQVSPPSAPAKKKFDAPHVTPPAPIVVVQTSDQSDKTVPPPAQVAELTAESADSLWRAAADTLGGTAAGMAQLASNVTLAGPGKLVVQLFSQV